MPHRILAPLDLLTDLSRNGTLLELSDALPERVLEGLRCLNHLLEIQSLLGLKRRLPEEIVVGEDVPRFDATQRTRSADRRSSSGSSRAQEREHEQTHGVELPPVRLSSEVIGQ